MAQALGQYTIVNVSDGQKGDAARTYVTLTSGYDLNEARAKDTVYVSSSTSICSSLLNKPSRFISGEVRVEVEWLGSNSYLIQRLFCKAGASSKNFSRTYSAGTWGAWVENKGEKGDPGTQGASAEAIVQYALVRDGESVSDASWSEIVPEYLAGCSYWRRIRTVWSDGRADSYSDPQRDDVLTTTMKSYSSFSFRMNRATYRRDMRNPSQSTVVQFSPSISGYGLVTPVFSADNVDLPSFSLEIPCSDRRSSIKVTMKAEYNGSMLVSDAQELKCMDETVPAFYLGAFDSAPSDAQGMALIEGDWYFDRTTGSTKVFDGSVWSVIDAGTPNYSTMALSTLPDKFISASGVVDESVVENQFVRNLIVKYVTAERIGAMLIELLSGGALKSSGYSKGTVQNLINGVPLPEGSPEHGFHMDSSGEAEFYKASMYEVLVNNGILNNVTVNGEIGADTFTTLKDNIVSSLHRAKDITQGNSYWSEGEASDALSSYASDVFTALSGSYGGSAFSSAIKLSEEQRTRNRVLGEKTGSGGTSIVLTVSQVPAAKVNVRFNGRRSRYRLASGHGQVSLEGNLRYAIGSKYTSFPDGEVSVVAGKTSLILQDKAPDVPDSAVFFKTKKSIPGGSVNLGGYAVKVGQSVQDDVVVLKSDLSTMVMLSGDGTVSSSWTPSFQNDFRSGMESIAYGNGKLVILDSCYAATNSNIPMTKVSTNLGRSFTDYNRRTDGCSRGSFWSELIFFNGYFYAFYYPGVGNSSSGWARSEDGYNWTSYGTDEYRIPYILLADAVVAGGYVYGVCYSYSETESSGARIARTSDLKSWTEIGVFSMGDTSTEISSFSYSGGRFFICRGGSVFASEDCSVWWEEKVDGTPVMVVPTSTPSVMTWDGTACREVYEAKAALSDFTVTVAANLSVSCDYSTLSAGWSLLDEDGEQVGAIQYENTRMIPTGTSFSISDGDKTLFNSPSATKWYRQIGIEKVSGSAYVPVQSGVTSRLYGGTPPVLSYRRYGESKVTVASADIKGVFWSGNSTTFSLSSGANIVLAGTDWFSELTFSFTPIGRARGNYTENIFPESNEDEREESINIGAAENRFDNMYSKSFHGALDGAAAKVRDSYNGNDISVTYGKAGQNSTSWLASWNGYELGAISPSKITAGACTNADQIDGYHASSLLRSDGGSWNRNANITLSAGANNDEWSFDIQRNGYTGCYWHVWDSSLGSLLVVKADTGIVSAPKGFEGNVNSQGTGYRVWGAVAN